VAKFIPVEPEKWAEMVKAMAENARLKAEVERLQSIHSIDSIGIEQLKAEVERLQSDIQMEKENEDRLVREWQKANNEVYGLQRQVAALIDDQTRLKADVERLQGEQRLKGIPVEARLIDRLAELKAEVERLTKAGDAMAKRTEFFQKRWDADELCQEVEAWQAAKEGKQS